MSLFNWIIIAVIPGAWLVLPAVKIYQKYIKRQSHDTSEIMYLLSDAILHKNGKRHKPYAGSFINLTSDISRVTLDKNDQIVREYI